MSIVVGHPTLLGMYHQQPKWVRAALGKSLIISPNQANVVVIESQKNRLQFYYSVIHKIKVVKLILSSMVSSLCCLSRINRFMLIVVFAPHTMTWILTLFLGINHLVTNNWMASLSGNSLASLHSSVFIVGMPILNSSHLLICVVTQRSRGISRFGSSFDSVRCRSAMWLINPYFQKVSDCGHIGQLRGTLVHGVWFVVVIAFRYFMFW